jgi:putative membrane protein
MKKRLKKWSLVTGSWVVAAGLLAVPLSADHHEEKKTGDVAELAEAHADHSPKAVLRHGAMANQMEIELARLALEKAQSAEVKQFAKKIIDEHGKADRALEELAAKHDIKLPVGLEGKYQQKVQRLHTLSAEEFDREYMLQTVQNHQRSIAVAEEVARENEEPKVRQFVQSKLPALREHLDEAKRIARSVGVDEGAFASAGLTDSEGTGAPAVDAQGGTGVGGVAVDSQGVGLPDRSAEAPLPDDAEEVRFEDLPETVQRAVRSHGSPEQVSSIHRFTKDGSVRFKVEYNRSGADPSILIGADGAILRDSR